MKHSDLKLLRVLKEDIFGTITHVEIEGDGRQAICRNVSGANPFVRCIAYFLAGREAAVLKKLSSIEGDRVPKLIYFGNGICVRSYIEGDSLRKINASDLKYYDSAREILGEIHALGVVHNDLEKPENWLVTKDNVAAIIDFQLACFFRKKGLLYRLAQREDIRHAVKNKKRYCASGLSEEERNILENKSYIARLILAYFKPIYNYITRRILGYSDRDNSRYSR